MEPKEFNKLKKTWYDKLKKSGFEDIELNQDDNSLSLKPSINIGHMTPDRIAAKEAYYIYAGQFLHEHEFKDTREKLIWKCHAEGMIASDICKELARYRIKLRKSRVSKIFKDLATIMLKEKGITRE